MAYHTSARREPRRTKQCPHCNELHTNRHMQYCSVMCENGTRPIPEDDPRSDGYVYYIKRNPSELVGETLVDTDGVFGTVYDYDDGRYCIESEHIESGVVYTFSVDETAVLNRMKNENLWVE